MDITSAAQEWYRDNTTNHGIAIYPINEYNDSGTYARAGFYSVNYNEILPGVQPIFRIHYRDTKGLESIWTYSSHGAGSAGVGYVNGFNGNLVLVHNDMTTQGSILPISVSHVYNSCLAEPEYIYKIVGQIVGKGWWLSLAETLIDEEIDGQLRYLYHDADGTELYFMPVGDDGSHFKSEDGYGLYLTVASDMSSVMTDDYGNLKRFDILGHLREIEDVYGNVRVLPRRT